MLLSGVLPSKIHAQASSFSSDYLYDTWIITINSHLLICKAVANNSKNLAQTPKSPLMAELKFLPTEFEILKINTRISQKDLTSTSIKNNFNFIYIM